MLISFNPCGQTSQNFHHAFFYNFITRSYGYVFKRNVLYHFVLNVVKMGVLKRFWCENALSLYGLTTLSGLCTPIPKGREEV